MPLSRKLKHLALALGIAFVLPAAHGAEYATHYFRHLSFNHNSPYFAYVGTDEIDAEQAKTVEHYEFVFDDKARPVEIRTLSSEAWRNHPLTHLGAFRTTFAYEGNREIRRFYDKDGNRMRNLRNVYEEVFSIDAKGNKRGLAFFDLQGQPMQTNWGIARYAWEKQGDRLIERRYGLDGRLVPMAPGFPFHISGIRLGANGHVAEHCNLDDDLKVVDDPNGIACFRDVTAADGRLLGLTYYNQAGEVVNSPWSFAIVRLAYDANGNVICEDRTDKNGLSVGHDVFVYDSTGKIVPPKT